MTTKQTKRSIYEIRNVFLRTLAAWVLAIVVLIVITVGAAWVIILAFRDMGIAAWGRISLEWHDLKNALPWRNLFKSMVGR